MNIKPLATPLAIVMVLGGLVVLAGCGGNDREAQGTSTIQGHVAQVLTAMEQSETQPTPLARLQAFFAFIATAQAQGADLSGITVIAQLDGVTLDTTVTDASGSFTLTVPGGALTLVFITDDFEVTLALTVPDNSDLTLTVALQPNDTSAPVVVEHMDVVHHPIVCTSDTVTLTGASELVIDGHGGACIHATGNCTIDTDFSAPVDIRFTHCDQCIRAEGNAVISLITDGSIACVEALADGIRTRGKAKLDAQAGTTITISAAEDGIDASGTSSVHLQAAGAIGDDTMTPEDEPIALITVMGATGINAQGNAAVDIEAPGVCAVLGTTEHLSQSGNASITTTCVE